jgi:hypothetical protein
MMWTHRRALRAVGFSVVALGVAIAAAEACSVDIVFRAYLRQALWKPTWKYVSELAARLPAEKSSYDAYAGMSDERAGRDLEKARSAYRALFADNQSASLDWPDPVIGNLRDLLRTTSAANAAEAHELALLRCKVELRGWKPGDDAGLGQVRACFEAYVAQPRPSALGSEARGWLARTEFLAGNGASAAAIYMSELSSETSNIRRDRLLESLRMIHPRLEDLDDYFDTPAHALFASNQITTNHELQALTTPLVERLERHESLFGRGAQSDALAIALMRAAVQSGAPAATLRYAERIPGNATTRRSAEYNWLVGTARFQEKDYVGAERALRSVLNAGDADPRQKAYAANGLVGVYARLNRPVDALWAAFQAESLIETAVPQSAPRSETMPVYSDYYYEMSRAEVFGYLDFDVSYLLDAGLTDSELEQSAKHPLMKPSDVRAIRYAVAVRRARHERFAEAAEIYEDLGAPRATLMHEFARVFAQTKATRASRELRLEALYEYARFLSLSENEVFFNDRLWHGFQTSGFYLAARFADNDARVADVERHLRDEQEEYWRAYVILNKVVNEAGPTPLGKKAAELAITSLRSINSRFGRAEEIRSADLKLSSWLARNR